MISIDDITIPPVNLVSCEASVGLINNCEIACECTPIYRREDDLHRGEPTARVVDVVDRVDGILLAYCGGYHVVSPRIGNDDPETGGNT